MPRYKYELPSFLEEKGIDGAEYRRWLDRRAASHYKRDRRRGNKQASKVSYKEAIHKVILESNGLDAYTGKELDWGLISKYKNAEAAKGGREYKKKFKDLPTVDHVGDGTGPADFEICSWCVNDCKNDLTLTELLKVCDDVRSYSRRPRA